jgi:hypothetical protein
MSREFQFCNDARVALATEKREFIHAKLRCAGYWSTNLRSAKTRRLIGVRERQSLNYARLFHDRNASPSFRRRFLPPLKAQINRS